jgi:hypothetical protein
MSVIGRFSRTLAHTCMQHKCMCLWSPAYVSSALHAVPFVSVRQEYE